MKKRPFDVNDYCSRQKRNKINNRPICKIAQFRGIATFSRQLATATGVMAIEKGNATACFVSLFHYCSEKFFFKAWSFRMMPFPPREATTTAEPPEPLYSSVYGIHYMQTNSSEDWRPGGEAHWSPLVSVRGSISIILAAAWALHAL
ncbi:MAG: hypothetical protein IKP87_13760 [Victivallales bacterium]|nr:hypothetical protein [Victivallales bacterium]